MNQNGHNGHSPTQVGSLDMAKPADRVLVGQSRRWKTDPEFREQCVRALKAALHLSLKSANGGNTGAIRDVNACIRNAALLEGHNQADEHLALKNNRLDDGDATERIRVEYIHVDRITH